MWVITFCLCVLVHLSQGRTFLQITDLHLDLKYAVQSDIIDTSCHAKSGGARPLGERWYCDSPELLIDKSLHHIASNTSPDFILLTGDFGRHDDYPPVPRGWDEILEENARVANKIAKQFPGVPVLPSIGNNDVFPHDVMDPPGPNNTILSGLADAWAPYLDPSLRQMMVQGGWLVKKLRGTYLISLNTLYFAYGPDCNVSSSTALQQLEWLSALFTAAQTSHAPVIISGHIPPHLWLPSCRALYANLCTSFRSIIRGHIYAHLHSDQFHFVNVDGTVDGPSLAPNKTVAFTCAPSIVPSYNPSFRVWQYDDPVSMQITDYTQYYADIDVLNKGGPFSFQQEYSLKAAYGMTGSLSQPEFWISLNTLIKNNATLLAQYNLYKYVMRTNPGSSQLAAVEKKIALRR